MRRRLLYGVLVLALLGGTGLGLWWTSRETPDGPSVEATCARLQAAQGLDAAIVGLDPNRLGPLVTELDGAVLVAPADVAEQLRTLAAFVGEIAEEIRAEPTDKRGALTAALAARQDRVDAVGAAGTAVETWFGDNCGGTLRATTTTAPRSTTTTR